MVSLFYGNSSKSRKSFSILLLRRSVLALNWVGFNSVLMMNTISVLGGLMGFWLCLVSVFYDLITCFGIFCPMCVALCLVAEIEGN